MVDQMPPLWKRMRYAWLILIASTKATYTEEPRVRTKVRKTKGYPFPGEVVASFATLSGQPRVVVECTVPEVAGCLHIYSPEQLEIANG